MKQFFSKQRFVWNTIFYVITLGAAIYFSADAIASEGQFSIFNALFFGFMGLFVLARLIATVFEYIRQEKLRVKYVIDMVTSALLVVMMILAFFYGAKYAEGVSKEFLAVCGVLAVILAAYLVTYSIKAWKIYNELDETQKKS